MRGNIRDLRYIRGSFQEYNRADTLTECDESLSSLREPLRLGIHFPKSRTILFVPWFEEFPRTDVRRLVAKLDFQGQQLKKAVFLLIKSPIIVLEWRNFRRNLNTITGFQAG
uniref:Uncharacterized protein n=1 Tax=Candidatus Kentrum sp. LFY TaxID=2126342 RepID=A0A450WX85_9GAMM|nr:MAG: hypothetical protein BECKLFY1418A_GA0070994_103412 [Candidatus Kentron sp. LFY]VFJ93888.1 MAG: hypothetical protein BECKLFY1418B_GA0070995_10516 [Candidatus Kentron sp. LFY]VFK21633.1 MAG: hypothetical protein BECKLFY1418C_GA0070996_10987 [Candidatus Kentron sp. LFY]